MVRDGRSRGRGTSLVPQKHRPPGQGHWPGTGMEPVEIAGRGGCKDRLTKHRSPGQAPQLAEIRQEARSDDLLSPSGLAPV